jgi:hypothetical protein
LYLPLLTGWRCALDLAEWRLDVNGVPWIYVESLHPIPGSDKVMLSNIRSEGQAKERTVSVIGPAGTRDAIFIKVLDGTRPVAVIPVDATDYLALDARHASLMRREIRLSEFDMDTTYPGVWYHPLMFHRMLRVDRLPNDSLGLRLVLISIDTRSRLIRTLRFATPPREWSIVQNPDDGLVAMIWSSDSGVRGSFLNPYTLAPVDHDLQLSAIRSRVGPPVGIFFSDSLHLAWEDFRNGGSDIYSSASAVPVHGPFVPPNGDRDLYLPLDPRSDTLAEFTTPVDPVTSLLPPGAQHSTGAIYGVMLYPNPASDRLIVRYHLPRTAFVRLELFDSRGEMVRAVTPAYQPAGARTESMELGDLASGIYTVVVHADGSRSTVRAVIIRE